MALIGERPLRVLIDVVHPAHVHFYRHLIAELDSLGHETLVVAREKEMTVDLLVALGIPHTTIGRAGTNRIIPLAAALIRRVAGLVRVGRRFRPDVVLTRNPAGVIAARLLRAVGVFDTDDGRRVGIHWKAAVPFAHLITMPETLLDDFRGKRVAYPSMKALAFLHPNRFAPDPGVVADLGVAPGGRYFIVRFVSMSASHDRQAVGAEDALKAQIVGRLAGHGQVFISSESPLPDDLADYRFPLPPERMHDALAFASLLVGDTQSMVLEAALLGVPAVHVSSWHETLSGARGIGERHGLVRIFSIADDQRALLDALDELARTDDRDHWQACRARLLADMVDLTSWYRDFVLGLPRRYQSLAVQPHEAP